jgi:uncharacterized protein YjbI with pentapeptide repeats
MANLQHLEILQSGVAQWNKWRRQHPRIHPDLSNDELPGELDEDVRFLVSAVVNEVVPGRAPADEGGLAGTVLNGINFRRTNLANVRLDSAMLIEADLSEANLRDASLSSCVLTGAKMTRIDACGANFNAATLRWAELSRAKLTGANLRLANADGVRARHADLRDTDLFYASFVMADLSGADLSGASVYGISAWDVDLREATQERLVITRATEPIVTIDDLQVAQFLHLIISNQNIRTVIDTLATKVVLILGRFTPERKAVLEVVRDELRSRGFVPILFDFDRPASRDFTETVVTLAHLARFIIADLTDPASLPKELEAIVPRLAVPLLPLIERGSRPYAMFSDYWKYDWVLDIVEYPTAASLRRSFDRLVVRPAERAARSLARRRARASLPTGSEKESGRTSGHRV